MIRMVKKSDAPGDVAHGEDSGRHHRGSLTLAMRLASRIEFFEFPYLLGENRVK